MTTIPFVDAYTLMGALDGLRREIEAEGDSITADRLNAIIELPLGPDPMRFALVPSVTLDIHVGVENAPKDRLFLGFKKSIGEWDVLYAPSGADADLFTHWCELPGDPRNIVTTS